MKIRVSLSILLLVFLLTGCSLWMQNSSKVSWKEEKKQTLGMTPDFSYEVVVQTPKIVVNQIGFYAEDNKIAIFQGNDIDKDFYIYNALNHKKEYEGRLKAGNIDENVTGTEKEELYFADFSSFQKVGTYYLYHSDLGYSYEFKIQDGIYDDLEKNILALLDKEEKDTALVCYQLAGLLLARDLYSEYMLESKKVTSICEKKIESLLQAQDKKTGGVYTDISMAERIKTLDEIQRQKYISLAATADFAGVMAIYAYQMKNVNIELSNRCLAAAEKAYSSIQQNLDNAGYDAGYFAAAQLYRLTNQGKYAQAVGKYLTMKRNKERITEYDFTLFGDYACLTLCSGSNLEWSELVMKEIMEEAEEISLASGRNNYYVSEKREYNDIDGKLRDMSKLALVNYIITNHEYSTLQKNYLNYFLGRNPENVCLADGFGSANVKEGEAKIDGGNGVLFYLLLQSIKSNL